MGNAKGPKRSRASSEPGVPKKPKPPYNEKAAIRSALRQAWSRHPTLQEVLKRERIERPYIKKDGSVSSKPRVFFLCYVCKSERPRKEIDIDHRDPVGPTPGSTLAPPGLSWDTFLGRLFCAAENMATICKTCHRAKTNAETAERFRRLREIKDASELESSDGRKRESA